MLVYTVFAPNSRPQVRNPTISSPTLKIMVMAETGRGTKLESTIARPEILLTDAWLGIKKKNTAAAIIPTATVRIPASFQKPASVQNCFFCLFCSFISVISCFILGSFYQNVFRCQVRKQHSHHFSSFNACPGDSIIHALLSFFR